MSAVSAKVEAERPAQARPNFYRNPALRLLIEAIGLLGKRYSRLLGVASASA